MTFELVLETQPVVGVIVMQSFRYTADSIPDIGGIYEWLRSTYFWGYVYVRESLKYA